MSFAAAAYAQLAQTGAGKIPTTGGGGFGAWRQCDGSIDTTQGCALPMLGIL